MLKRFLGMIFNRRTTMPDAGPQGWPLVKCDYFMVTDADLADSLRAWMVRDAAARRKIAPFIKHHFTDAPLRDDENGKIIAVLHTNKFLYPPTGWYIDPLTLWTAPHTEAARKELDSFPPLPPRAELHRLLRWPTLPRDGENAYDINRIDALNHQVSVHDYGDTLYVAIPDGDALAATFRDEAHHYAHWNKPLGLRLCAAEEVESRARVCHALATGQLWPACRQD